jgi:hypothetical protein
MIPAGRAVKLAIVFILLACCAVATEHWGFWSGFSPYARDLLCIMAAFIAAIIADMARKSQPRKNGRARAGSTASNPRPLVTPVAGGKRVLVPLTFTNLLARKDKDSDI